MKWIEICLVMVVLAIMALLFTGCEEAQRTPKVWGQGDLPVAWQNMFGNDNLARLNYKQSIVLDRQGAIIYGIDIKDPNGAQVRKRGLIERITALESLAELQVTALEGLAERLKKLEEVVWIPDPNNWIIVDPNK